MSTFLCPLRARKTITIRKLLPEAWWHPPLPGRARKEERALPGFCSGCTHLPGSPKLHRSICYENLTTHRTILKPRVTRRCFYTDWKLGQGQKTSSDKNVYPSNTHLPQTPTHRLQGCPSHRCWKWVWNRKRTNGSKKRGVWSYQEQDQGLPVCLGGNTCLSQNRSDEEAWPP